MKLYISDLHFYHERIISLDKRPFENPKAMNQYMLDKWNSKVKGGDMVIVLGDMFGTKDPEEVNFILNRMAGKICLIEGNHDCVWLKKEGINLNRFEWIKPYAELSDGDSTVITSHYPVFCYNHQHVRKTDGTPRTYMLYGHVHNTYDEELVNEFQNMTRKKVVTNAQGITGPIPCQMINCFCGFSDFTPLSLHEWIEIDASRRQKINAEKVQ